MSGGWSADEGDPVALGDLDQQRDHGGIGIARGTPGPLFRLVTLGSYGGGKRVFEELLEGDPMERSGGPRPTPT
jgi:hypothetical protein